MITVNMHEAKTRLSMLVKAAIEQGEIIVLCRHGKPLAELRKIDDPPKKFNRLKAHRKLSRIKINYDPTEPLPPEEWPKGLR